MDRNKKFIVCALGITITFFFYAILQERVTRVPYGEGEDQERYRCILTLVFSQCVCGYLLAKLMLTFFINQGEDTTKVSYYASCALTYLLAMVCSSMALQWVSYPAQVIAKSGKPLPVMFLGVLLARKSYPLKKYFFVFCIVAGIALFMYKDGNKSSSPSDSSFGFGLGELLLILSLLMDGITASIQERMKSEHSTKSYHMMINMNLWSMLFLGPIVLLTGDAKEFVGFVDRHPEVLWNILLFSLATAVGQIFIYLTVSEFGPLPCSIITTTRKFFTVLGSVLIFGNALLTRQWLATILVFSGLFLDAFYGKTAKRKEEN